MARMVSERGKNEANLGIWQPVDFKAINLSGGTQFFFFYIQPKSESTGFAAPRKSPQRTGWLIVLRRLAILADP